MYLEQCLVSCDQSMSMYIPTHTAHLSKVSSVIKYETTRRPGGVRMFDIIYLMM